MKETLYLLLSLVNQSTFWSEFSSTLLGPFAVLGTPMKGYQKSGTVQFAILVPFTISDSGNGNNCVLYRNVPLSGNEPKDAYIHRCFSSSHGATLILWWCFHTVELIRLSEKPWKCFFLTYSHSSLQQTWDDGESAGEEYSVSLE